jgi:hypothetical protein
MAGCKEAILKRVVAMKLGEVGTYAALLRIFHAAHVLGKAIPMEQEAKEAHAVVLNPITLYLEGTLQMVPFSEWTDHLTW